MKQLISYLFLFNSLISFAQEQTPKEKEQFANSMVIVGEFSVAITIYEELIAKGNANPSIYYHLGLSKMETHDPLDALPYLQKAKEQGFSAYISHSLKQDQYDNQYYSFDLDFSLARAYQINSQFDKAIEYFTKYSQLNVINQNEKEITLHYISQSKVGLELSKNQKKVKILNLGGRVNSKYDDFGALVYQDTSSIIFTRKQPNRDKQSVNIDGTFKEDVFITYKRTDGKWMESFRISEEINVDGANDFGATLYNDDKNLIVTYDKGVMVQFDRNGTQWRVSKKFKQFAKARSVSICGNLMVIASDYYGTAGDLDLFYSIADAEGSWSEFVALPITINTVYEESYPFLDPLDKTLYFSSNGNQSSGGYDVFKALYNPLTKIWEKAENLGYPINTPRDDIYFTYHSNTNVAYYNSYRLGGFGGLDIYMVDYNFQSDKESKINLKVVSKDKKEVLSNVNVAIVDQETKQEVKFVTNQNGMVEIPVFNQQEYRLVLKCKNYMFLDTTIKLPAKTKIYDLLLELEYLEEGKKITLTNVQFDRNEAILKTESNAEIDRVFTFLSDNPELSIEIAGHTELGGIENQNKELSQQRADAVKQYLVAKGIDQKRLLSVGYGSRFPLTKGNTEEEKSINRRTEVILHLVGKESSNLQPYYK